MRIVGGSSGGRRLVVPPSGTRPTTDRVREALFSSLGSHVGDWTTVRFLDLYAGSGAIGLEALSRGASRATLVERDRRTAAVLRRNVDTLGLPGAHVVIADATGFVADQPYDVIYIDPPYAVPDDEVTRLLQHLHDTGAVAPGGLAVVERSLRSESPWPDDGWSPVRRRAYGETCLWYGQVAG